MLKRSSCNEMSFLFFILFRKKFFLHVCGLFFKTFDFGMDPYGNVGMGNSVLVENPVSSVCLFGIMKF